MNSRPISVTMISLLFVIAGASGIFYHVNELKNFSAEVAWVFMVRLLAIVGGAFCFRGANWARWLIIGWMGYHVVLSFFHTNVELLIHIGFLAVAIYALFNKGAAAYFSPKKKITDQFIINKKAGSSPAFLFVSISYFFLASGRKCFFFSKILSKPLDEK